MDSSQAASSVHVANALFLDTGANSDTTGKHWGEEKFSVSALIMGNDSFFYATGLFCNLTVIVGSLAAGILPFVHFICSVSLALLKAFSGFFFSFLRVH